MSPMGAPQRIQLSRRKGFNLRGVSLALNGLPAINCARPHKWGNPYQVRKGERSGLWLASASVIGWAGAFDDRESAIAQAVAWHREWALSESAQRFAELRGHNLACWCAIGSPCHADVLLKIANAPQEPAARLMPRPEDMHGAADEFGGSDF